MSARPGLEGYSYRTLRLTLQLPSFLIYELSGSHRAVDRAVLANSSSSPLEDRLRFVCQAVEAQSSDLVCSILVLDANGTHLFHGAAPSLPESYIRAINGSPIGPSAGSCGTAAYLDQPVIVSNIATDPRWAKYRDLALPHGLRACWSTPIRSRDAKVLGTFAIYYREARLPTSEEQQIVQWATPLAALVIEDMQFKDALKQQHEQLEIILDTVPAMIWYKDGSNTILHANRAAADSLGLRKSDLEGRSAYELYPEHAAKCYQDDLEVIRSGRPRLGIKKRLYTGTGEERLLLTDKIPYRNADGEIIGVIVFATDVTERTQAERALKEADAHFRAMVDQAPYGILRLSPQGKFLAVNPASVTMLGYGSAEELLAVEAASVVYVNPQDLEHFIAASSDISSVDVLWRKKNGSQILVRLGGRPVRDKNGMIASIDLIAEDVTERRKLEEQLRQAQKMEAVGRLAGGIAHDFNNLLTIMKGHVGLLEEELGLGHPCRRRAEQVSQAADRAASLTQQLLAFSRMQILQPRVINMNTVVTEIEKLIRPVLGENIELALKLDPALGSTLADPSQMEQVILNLVVNACDAMPAGGKLTIRTANVELSEAWARLHPPSVPGWYVLLTVNDTGVGMEPEVQAHIFEPFFTTKEQGKGTGLGLAMVYGIVKQSNGYIWVTSRPGLGTSFQVYLPLVDRPSPVTEPSILSSKAPGGPETILLVEDEDGVRELIAEILLQSGYNVLSAKNGAEAIEIAQQHPRAIQLLITDIVMPGLRGPEVAVRLSELYPGIGVIYMTGFSAPTELLQEQIAVGVVLLQKPFSRENLTQAVRDVLERRSSLARHHTAI
jgi:two-component system, cell cycle sensor histidine kinase and response regulator CckA